VVTYAQYDDRGSTASARYMSRAVVRVGDRAGAGALVVVPTVTRPSLTMAAARRRHRVAPHQELLYRVMTIDDVAAFASSLPDVIVGTRWGHQTWSVGKHAFAWKRTFSKADLKRFGEERPPSGDILAVAVENLDAKDALLSMSLAGFFTIPHFNGYAAVLVALRAARKRDVRAAVLAAWKCMAPRTSLAKLDTPTRRRAAPPRPKALRR
jgi:hypothetical protein